MRSPPPHQRDGGLEWVAAPRTFPRSHNPPRAGAGEVGAGCAGGSTFVGWLAPWSRSWKFAVCPAPLSSPPPFSSSRPAGSPQALVLKCRAPRRHLASPPGSTSAPGRPPGPPVRLAQGNLQRRVEIWEGWPSPSGAHHFPSGYFASKQPGREVLPISTMQASSASQQNSFLFKVEKQLRNKLKSTHTFTQTRTSFFFKAGLGSAPVLSPRPAEQQKFTLEVSLPATILCGRAQS